MTSGASRRSGWARRAQSFSASALVASTLWYTFSTVSGIFSGDVSSRAISSTRKEARRSVATTERSLACFSL